MSKKKILVPTDFTQVAEVAVKHAVKTAQIIDAEVYLLHVVDKPTAVDKAKIKLDEEAKLASASIGQNKVHTLVRIGSIFEDIGDVAIEMDVELIFMGTHGMKGMQHILGSHAMKVITNSEIPFVVVQEKQIKESGYDDIVVPVDFTQETKQLLVNAANMAKYFNSRIHLISPHKTDEWLKNKVTRNMNFAKAFMKERNIDFTATILEDHDLSFDKQVIRFASKTEADLIAIMNMNKNSLIGVLGKSYEQVMITNDAEIPVMIVNPKEVGIAAGQGLFN